MIQGFPDGWSITYEEYQRAHVMRDEKGKVLCTIPKHRTLVMTAQEINEFYHNAVIQELQRREIAARKPHRSRKIGVACYRRKK